MIPDDRWRRVEEVFHDALDLPSGDRQAFLAAACAGDSELRREVASLLAAEAAGVGLEQAVEGSAAEWLGSVETPLPTDPDALIGRELGRYRVVERIGSGGMGAVYRADDRSLGRAVALKVLKPQLFHDPDRRRRFEEEARSASALNHPNIVVIHEIGRSAELDFIATELVEGVTLRARLATGPLPLRELLAVGIQVADGLAAAHRAGIVHRDVKPDNIMVRVDGVVKIVDFGIAKLAERSVRVPAIETRTGAVLGTVSYMSPEQALGEPVDHRTDLFALGVVIHEMATGAAPFEGSSDAAVYDALLHHAPARASLLNPRLPAELDRILARALEKDPELRYQTAIDLAAELKRAQRASSDHPVASRRGAPGDAVAVRQPSAMFPWAVAAAAIALAAVAVAWAAMASYPAGSPDTGARRFEVVLPFLAEPEQVAGPPVVISPAGDRLVYVRIQAATRLLSVRDFATLEDRPLEGTEFAQTPFFSPDGEQVGYFARGELRTIRLAGGPPSIVREVLGQRGAAWIDRGTIVASSNDRLVRVSTDGTAVETIASPRRELGENAYQWPEILPDGRTLLYTLIRTSAEQPSGVTDLYALRLGSDERRLVLRDASYARYARSGHLLFSRSGALETVPFDPARAEVLGSPVAVAGGVAGIAGGVQPDSSSSFSISNEGTLVYVPGTPAQISRTTVWIDRSGGAEPIGEGARGLVDPSISPDGRTLAMINHDEVWLMDLERGARRKIRGGSSRYMAPIWSPDGRNLAYTRWEPGGGMAIYSAPVSHPDDETLIWKSDGPSVFPLSFTPDGRTLACMRVQGPGRFDIWIVKLDPAHPAAPLVASPASEQHPQFSPDGRWLAYSSDESGRYEIYVQPFPAGGGKWPVSAGGGVEPRWSSSGRELFYRTGNALMAVAIEPGPAFAAGPPRQLFTGNYQDVGVVIDYAVAPGASRFLMARRTDADPAFTHLQLRLNAFADLRRLTRP